MRSSAFAKGYEGGGTVEGIRAALALATLLDYIVEFSICGAIVGTVYRPLRRPSAASVAV